VRINRLDPRHCNAVLVVDWSTGGQLVLLGWTSWS
jgi:hypothetical protein